MRRQTILLDRIARPEPRPGYREPAPVQVAPEAEGSSPAQAPERAAVPPLAQAEATVRSRTAAVTPERAGSGSCRNCFRLCAQPKDRNSAAPTPFSHRSIRISARDPLVASL